MSSLWEGVITHENYQGLPFVFQCPLTSMPDVIWKRNSSIILYKIFLKQEITYSCLHHNIIHIFARLGGQSRESLRFRLTSYCLTQKITRMDLLYGYHVVIVNYAVIGFPSHAVWADIAWLLFNQQIVICCLVI